MTTALFIGGPLDGQRNKVEGRIWPQTMTTPDGERYVLRNFHMGTALLTVYAHSSLDAKQTLQMFAKLVAEYLNQPLPEHLQKAMEAIGDIMDRIEEAKEGQRHERQPPGSFCPSFSERLDAVDALWAEQIEAAESVQAKVGDELPDGKTPRPGSENDPTGDAVQLNVNSDKPIAGEYDYMPPLCTQVKPVVHLCPPEGEALTPCCGKAPFALPLNDRVTANKERVTCGKDRPADDIGEGIETGSDRCISDQITDPLNYVTFPDKPPKTDNKPQSWRDRPPLL